MNTRRSPLPHNTQCNRYGLQHLWWLVITMLLVGGCEARLDLSGVEQELEQVVRRADQLLAIQRSAADTLVVFGNNGLILRKVSATEQWQRAQLTPEKPNFVDATTCPDGTLAGLSYERGLWHSQDDGVTWTYAAIPLEEDLQAITCTANNTLWLVGSFSSLINTPDRGVTWIDLSLGEDAMLTSITFTSADQGFAAGEFGVFLTTQDGGANWQQTDPIQNDFYPLALYFEDAMRGWAGSLNGLIMTTTDGGQTWRKQTTETHAPIYGFIDTSAGLLAVGNQSTLLALNRDRWLRRPVPTEIPAYLRAGIVLENTLFIIGGKGTLLALPLDATLSSPLASAAH